MISNHALKKVRLSLSTWQLLLVSTRWQINLSPENKLLKQHNLGQFGCSSLVKKFDRNCPTFLINYPVPTKVWEIPQTLCVVGMTTYYGINFKNSKSVKIFQDMHCKNVWLICYLSVILSFYQMNKGVISQFSCRFTKLAIVNLPDVKLANLTSVQWTAALFCVLWCDKSAKHWIFIRGNDKITEIWQMLQTYLCHLIFETIFWVIWNVLMKLKNPCIMIWDSK